MRYLVLRMDPATSQEDPSYQTFGPWTHGFKTSKEAHAFAEEQARKYPYMSVAVFERRAVICRFQSTKVQHDRVSKANVVSLPQAKDKKA